MIRKLLSLNDERGRAVLRRLLAWTVVAAVLQGIAFVLFVPFLAALIDGDDPAAGRWLAALGAAGAGYAAAFWAASRLANTSCAETLRSLLTRLGDRLVELPIGWFAEDRAGELADLATRKAEFAANAPYAVLRPIITAFVTPATVLVGALFIDWRIALTMACAVPVMWLVYRWLARRAAAADLEYAAAVADTSSRVIEFARVQPALRAAGENSISRRLVDEALRVQHDTTRRTHLATGSGVGVFGAVVQAAVIAVLAMATWLAVGGGLEIPTVVAVLVLVVRFTEPIVHSGALGGGISMASNTLDQVQRILDEPALPEPAAAVRPTGYGIRFDSVTFGYGGEPVLRDLGFEAPAGRMTAIVGPSGAGKTTITRLIARFYDPEDGTVLIGGVPLPEIGSARIAEAVAPVFQDVYLFDGSILDNIRLGDPQATDEQVREAGRHARVDEIAARLPGGWDARVGEGGTNLSGGERQRVSIARALLKDAPIVLLDEATAALDIGNEQAVQDAFARIRQGRTLVVVAHRLQTIAAADRIIMLDGAGGIAEQGTHGELLAAGRGYADYWNERVNAAGWRLAASGTDTESAADAGPALTAEKGA